MPGRKLCFGGRKHDSLSRVSSRQTLALADMYTSARKKYLLCKAESQHKQQLRRRKKATMDPKLAEVSQLFGRFNAALTRNDFDTCTNLLSQLKVLLTEFKSLPPLFEKTPNATGELTLAREVYEHAVILSVKMEDQDAFERDFCQLKPYYTDACDRIPPSPQEYPILGLNLLRLLVQNRIAEFHTELELLSPAALENPCIKHAVELEQSFMEGAYNRVLSARQTVPHQSFAYFMDLLAKTVRDEIAGCSEKAYDYLSINDARQILLFSSDQQLMEYIKEVDMNELELLVELICIFPNDSSVVYWIEAV
ncbi:hypothetical protein SAY86_004056 [Trapa natans]|uniref:PCI domain-containing protein n=1 Tax=Trapa natans TaxID=22666 RepID=A0AAN7MF91_TRANT|nr:hypothetical protein SAY86_004056 [Trapa natans]